MLPDLEEDVIEPGGAAEDLGVEYGNTVQGKRIQGDIGLGHVRIDGLPPVMYLIIERLSGSECQPVLVK